MAAKMMHPDMLLLAERLVIAMETMSQDVKNMSAYVYDLSCSVSCLLNEKKEKECTSVAAYDEGAEPPSGTPAASLESEFSEQYEHADERSLSHIGDPECGEISLACIASTSYCHKNSECLSSETNPIFTGEMKIEDSAEGEVNDESHDVHNVYEDSRNIIKAGMVFVSRLPEADTSIARTQEMESANHTSVVHTRGRMDERSFKCSLCGKSFRALGNLQNHIRVHTGERPYKCNECGKAFTQRYHLTQHMHIHSGHRPFRCTVCGKAFTRRNDVTIHMRSHTGERPYKCNMCGKTFRQRQHLRVHAQAHV